MKIVKGFEKAKLVLSRDASCIGLCLPAPASKGKTRDKEPPTEKIVRKILREVRRKGDDALLKYTKKLDGAKLKSLEVTRDEISEAYQKVDKALLSALELATKRIEEFHTACRQILESGFLSHGVGRQVTPLSRVGIYIPGGTAAYPSTVLMTAIPARVAGVAETLVATPPKKDGTIAPSVLVAADIAKVARVFKIGGAQAIAALAFGTESVPKVDKICGPGNVFVITAKKMVYGVVDIESLPGPSELMIVADDSADASFCAADLIAQAEHDPLASAILITTSPKLADSVDNEIKLQLAKLERQAIAREALETKGVIAVVASLDEAIELVNLYAPEHVSLMLQDPSNHVLRIRNAGCIFIGSDSSVAFGDYVAGPSHVLPTGGSARFASPLGIEDFIKLTNIVALDKSEGKNLAAAAITIAEAEGLEGHAQAIRIRL